MRNHKTTYGSLEVLNPVNPIPQEKPWNSLSFESNCFRILRKPKEFFQYRFLWIRKQRKTHVIRTVSNPKDRTVVIICVCCTMCPRYNTCRASQSSSAHIWWYTLLLGCLTGRIRLAKLKYSFRLIIDFDDVGILLNRVSWCWLNGESPVNMIICVWFFKDQCLRNIYESNDSSSFIMSNSQYANLWYAVRRENMYIWRQRILMTLVFL